MFNHKRFAQTSFQCSSVGTPPGTLSAPVWATPSIYLILAAGLLILTGLACSFSVGDIDDGGEAGVTGITTCKAVDAEQKCVEPATEFEPAATVYASVQLVNISLGDRVMARWFQGTSQVQEFSLSMEQAGNGYVSFSLVPTGLLPGGDYSVQIFLNDSLTKTERFKIAGEAAAAAPIEQAVALPTQAAAPPPTNSAVQSVTTCRLINADFQCKDETTRFMPTDTLHASVEIADAPAGVIIAARWLQGDELVDETTYPLAEGGSGFIDFNLSPDKPFPVGSYRLEIYQDKVLVKQVELEVAGESTQ
ncbi:MAG: hypothetical protein U0401_25375 [Anaerolineae bacterium]